ncbi:MFS transporter [Pediococcus inopinatus]|uniref:MFS transporter n=2 Tax=Pediococcus inopinatus TaxID=114090 RepID=A0ABZ0Q1X9_9LACO|nr:MFS transporter [Pediococcus inopinatus]AVL00053.1 hypothetical protein PI20285_05020 [Pediococcus inopinatus]KRN61016.1 major facilitator superfamily permease [Pediococcus inopinatus]WPC20946.1 MFS transporter [Pediococcus inopinatus]
MLVTFIAGQLVRFNWHMSFWAYLITIPALIMFALFVPKIPKTELTTGSKVKGSTKKSKLPNAIFGYMILTFIVITFYMIMGIKVPTLMVNAGYGTATSASYVILGLSLGAMLGGILFGRVFTWLKDYILVAAFLSLGLAMFLIAISNTTWLTVLGGFLTGIGARLFFPWILNAVNLGGSGNIMATSLILIAYNLAGSLSPYTALLIQNVLHIDNIRNLFWINMIVFVILAVVMSLVNKLKNVRTTD